MPTPPKWPSRIHQLLPPFSHLLSQVSYSRGLPAKLAAAAAEADFKTVKRQAHSLKGSSGYIGAVQVRCRRRLLLAPDSPYLHRSYQPLFDAQVPVLSQTLVEISGAADPRAVTALIGELSAAIDTLRWEAKPFECCVSNQSHARTYTHACCACVLHAL